MKDRNGKLSVDGVLALVLFGIFAFMDITAEQEGIVFAVCGYDFIMLSDLLHGCEHHFIALYASAVVGKSAYMRG